jgi:hypothetical protein
MSRRHGSIMHAGMLYCMYCMICTAAYMRRSCCHSCLCAMYQSISNKTLGRTVMGMHNDMHVHVLHPYVMPLTRTVMHMLLWYTSIVEAMHACACQCMPIVRQRYFCLCAKLPGHTVLHLPLAILLAAQFRVSSRCGMVLKYVCRCIPPVSTQK